jgi:hypothetical protein
MADLQLNAVKVNLIDSASTDSTYDVMREYSKKCGSPLDIGRADHPGTGLARNVLNALRSPSNSLWTRVLSLNRSQKPPSRHG